MDLFVIGLLTGIFSFIPLIYAFYKLLEVLNVYKSNFVFSLVVINLLGLIWVTTGFTTSFMTDFYNDDLIKLLDHIGIICSVLALTIFSIIFTRYSKSLYANVSTIIFSILIGIKINEILNKSDEILYGIQKNSANEWLRITHPLVSILFFVGFIFLSLTFISYSITVNSLPNTFINLDTKLYNKIFVFLFLSGFSVNLFTLIFISGDIYLFAQILFLISRVFIAISLIFISMQLSQNPLVFLNEGGNPLRFMETGLIGYLLVSDSDKGPGVYSVSEQFKKYYGLTFNELTSYSVGTVVVTGISSTFEEAVFTIPFPTRRHKLATLGFSFKHKNEELSDPRKDKMGNSIFAVVLPKDLLPIVNNVSDIYPILDRKIKSTENIHEFALKENLDKLSLEILRRIFI